MQTENEKKILDCLIEFTNNLIAEGKGRGNPNHIASGADGGQFTTGAGVTLSSQQVKDEIKKLSEYNIEKLNKLAERSGIPLITINFWWNAIKY